jgi:hypothetical protein
VRFVVHDVEVEPIRSIGRFDAVICLGLLSHLPNPGDVLDDMNGVADGLYLWCHLCREDEARGEAGRLDGRWVREPRPPDLFAGLSPVSFWPTRPALLARLEANGFVPLAVDDEPDHPHGPAIAVIAAKEDGGGG